MLRDEPIRRKGNDLPRRWTSDDYFDLIVWYESDASVYGFQLCYDKYGAEKALTWTRQKGFAHRVVDNGEQNATRNRSPILAQHVPFLEEKVVEAFHKRSGLLSESVRNLVLVKLQEFRASMNPMHQTVAPKPKA